MSGVAYHTVDKAYAYSIGKQIAQRVIAEDLHFFHDGMPTVRFIRDYVSTQWWMAHFDPADPLKDVAMDAAEEELLRALEEKVRG